MYPAQPSTPPLTKKRIQEKGWYSEQKKSDRQKAMTLYTTLFIHIYARTEEERHLITNALNAVLSNCVSCNVQKLKLKP
jgi:hypothetical protein